MADERFEDHLRHPRGQGEVAQGAHCGVAGGAACGDLVRIAIRVEGDRVAEASFAASGCGAASAAASAAIGLVSGAPVLEAAKIGTGDVAAELGGLSAGKIHAAELAADALARALGGAVAASAQLEEAPGRILIAMSGGVDSAVAAHLCADRAEEAPVAVTLELWRDEQNDAEGSCCSASAVQRARSLAHSLGLAHLTLDLREAFRAGVVEPWIAGHAAGKTPNPCVRCNGAVRLDAMLDLATRLGAAELATGHYARVGNDGLLRAAADPAKDQSYMLAALAPRSVARMLFPLGEMTKPEV
ncbi:MAG: iron-sulfur cluster assembly scaffold protein, partial [Solirubrobacteraceae bacterium]|nr:iron-sulfur cluster assembly scaffold protein [Solirubrobacteraceae bacterium]